MTDEALSILISRDEARRIAGVSRTDLDNWTHRRDFPAIRQPGRRRVWIHRARFLAWLDQLATTDTARLAVMRRKSA
jgi:hypothetical protein